MGSLRASKFDQQKQKMTKLSVQLCTTSRFKRSKCS